jgi:hypothetical protein
MKIELIVPAVEENARIPNLALPILAGLSPADVEISFTDDLLTPIDLGKDLKGVDLVGITVLSKTALRAYDIADAYRRKGIPVVLGGIHPTAAPEYLERQKGSGLGWSKMPEREISSPFTGRKVTQIYQECPCPGETFFLRGDIFP